MLEAVYWSQAGAYRHQLAPAPDSPAVQYSILVDHLLCQPHSVSVPLLLPAAIAAVVAELALLGLPSNYNLVSASADPTGAAIVPSVGWKFTWMGGGTFSLVLSTLGGTFVSPRAAHVY